MKKEMIGDILNEHDKQIAFLDKRLRKMEKLYKKHKKKSVNAKPIETPADILYCPHCGNESLASVFDGYTCIECQSYFEITLKEVL